MKLALPNFIYNRPSARRFTTNFLIVTVVNIVIALFLNYLMRTGLSIVENLVFSFCIGYMMWLFIEIPRLILWGIRIPPLPQFFLLCLVAVPSARILGNQLAVQLLGIPDKSLSLMWQQNTVRFFIFTILISVLIIWIFWNRGTLAHLKGQAEAEKARAAAIEKQAMQAQLQLLQAQIEPHMLFNTLANLQGLIAVDAPRAQHMLDQLILYLRATLLSSRAEQTTLAHEFSLMDAYLELMSIRMGARLSYALELPDHLREQCVPPMLLQPLIENAIKHGLEPKIDGGKITVVAKQEGNMLTLSVSDTGLGLQASGSTTSNGTNVGLENVRDRLKVIYGDRAAFSLTANTPSGVLAQLDIPLS